MTGMGSEVATGVHRIEAPLGDRYVACHLVVGDEAALLVDAGVDETIEGSILPYMNSIGLERTRLRWIVTTHCDVDHMGGNAAAKRAFPAAALVAHTADVDLIEDVGRIVRERYGELAAEHGIDIDASMRAWCFDVAVAAPVDVVVTGGERIRLGVERSVELFHTPGHSLGSLSVWDSTTRSAIVGDAVLGSSIKTAEGRSSFPPTYRYVVPYRSTISHLTERAPDLLLTAHEPVMDARAALDFLKESSDYMAGLESAVLSLLRQRHPRGVSTRELAESLAPSMGDWPTESGIFLSNGLVGHLEAWTNVGRVRAEFGPGGVIEWYWSHSA